MDDPLQSRYRLEPKRVVATVKLLSARIRERFPDVTLINVCDELLRLSHETESRAAWIGRPIVSVRLGAIVAIAIFVIALTSTMSQLDPSSRPMDMVLFVILTDAGINTIVLLAAAVYFLVTIEARIKRRRSLVAIHELRSLAHVIDMHQLTKDPDRLLYEGNNTKSSPVAGMSIYEMSRYLDYCGEMLSLVGKIAVIYSLQWHDTAAIQAVNDVERLTTGLSQKIFQKMMILHGTRFETA